MERGTAGEGAEEEGEEEEGEGEGEEKVAAVVETKTTSPLSALLPLYFICTNCASATEGNRRGVGGPGGERKKGRCCC